MTPRMLGLACAAVLVAGVAAPAAAAPGQPHRPRVTGPTFTVAVNGSVLSVTARGPSANFGADEELVLSKVPDGYRLSMNGEDAQERLVAASPCIGEGTQATTSVICPVPVISARLDYQALTSATLTAVATGIDVTFLGGSGPDEFYSSSGNDNLDGRAGDDVLFGDDEDGPYGNDTITGGVGVDVIDAFGGTNVVYAKDGIADKRVQCAGPDIPGSSGKATWDQGLDKPIACAAIGNLPDRPKDFAVSVGAWKGTGDDATVDLTFTWAKPTASQPTVTGYVLSVFAAGSTRVQIPSGSTTSQVVTLSVRDAPPSIPGVPLRWEAELVASNSAGTSVAAGADFETSAGLVAVTDVVGVPQNNPLQAVRVAWKPSTSSPVATLVGYRVERRVNATLRDGSEWLDLPMVDPTSTFKVDPCLPPGVSLDYRVTPLFTMYPTDFYPKKVVDGPSVIVAATAPPFSVVPPAPTGVQVDFNGIFTINGRAIQIFLEGRGTGPQVDPGQCFGLSYEYGAVDRKTGVKWTLAEDPMPRINGGAVSTAYPALYASGTAAGSTLGFSLRSRWVLDATWGKDYGRGWNAALVSSLVRAGQPVNATSTPVTSASDVYNSTTGASVSNLTVKRDAGTFAYRVSWTPPAASDPNTVNMRGYEVCSYSLINGVYSGLASNPKFPTYTTKMRCRV
ncbi:MAG: calcium-binding protein, partial [bacterium]